jgi:hypothetical protein
MNQSDNPQGLVRAAVGLGMGSGSELGIVRDCWVTFHIILSRMEKVTSGIARGLGRWLVLRSGLDLSFGINVNTEIALRFYSSKLSRNNNRVPAFIYYNSVDIRGNTQFLLFVRPYSVIGCFFIIWII